MIIGCFFFETMPVAGQTPSKDTSLATISTESHSINFPVNISFELIGKSHMEIDEILFYYQLTNTNVRGYGYTSITGIDSDTNNRGFRAVFKLSTSGSSYIPSGTNISYHFEIGYKAGEKQSTDPVSFDYLDPKYSWQKLESETITVFWHDVSESKIEEAVLKSETVLNQVSDLLEVNQKPLIRAVVINSQKESVESFPKISLSATRDSIYGGFAFQEYGVFIIRGVNVDGMIHEATHLLLGQKMDSPLAQVPAWLSEGIAMYFEIDNNHRKRTAEIGYLQKKLRPLSSMESVPGRSIDIRLFYAHSQEMVRYLIDIEGKEKFLKLLGQINSGVRADSAVIDVYGKNFDDLDKSWQATLSPAFDRRLLVDPGTFWTSVILGTTFLFAVIMSTITWSRKKSSSQSETIDEPIGTPDIGEDRGDN